MNLSLREILSKKLKTEVQSGDELLNIERIPTGIAGVDAILGGGLPKGRIIQIWGPESVGKSSLCLSMIKGVQMLEPEAEFVYLDCEGTVNLDDIKVQGIVGKYLSFINNIYGGEEVIDAALLAIENGARLAVIDSVPYLRPKKVLDEIQKDSAYRDVSGIANLLERVQQKLTRALEQSESCLIFINQERPKKGLYEPATYPGGSALKFMLSCDVHITGAALDKEDSCSMVQHLITNKNKTYKPKVKANVHIYNRVVQRGPSLMEMLIKHGLVLAKGGGNMELPEALAKELGLKTPKLGRGLEKVGKKLGLDTELYNTLYSKFLQAVKEGEIPKEEDRVEKETPIYEEEV